MAVVIVTFSIVTPGAFTNVQSKLQAHEDVVILFSEYIVYHQLEIPNVCNECYHMFYEYQLSKSLSITVLCIIYIRTQTSITSFDCYTIKYSILRYTMNKHYSRTRNFECLHEEMT